MQLSVHCLLQESLWQCSEITKRHRHCEAPAIPLPEQQPKPLQQQGKRQINCGRERGWALLPHTFTQDFCFTPRYLCCWVTTATRCPSSVHECSQHSVHRTDRGKKCERTAKSKVSILWVESASFSNLSSIVSIKILSHYNYVILFKHQQHIWPYRSYLTKIISEFPWPKCLQSRLYRKHWYRHPKEISTI